jgi:ABC-type amino acid transport substrate-binding protein
MLSPGDQARCDDFVFSAPFYEIVDGFFTLNGSDLVAATDLRGLPGQADLPARRLHHRGARGRRPWHAAIDLIRPTEATDCFEALAAGKVDLVSIDAEVGDSAIALLGMTGQFTQNPHLMTLQSLHVIAHKSNPRAVEMVVQLDSGLVEMYESGEWYDIVSTALAQNTLRQ